MTPWETLYQRLTTSRRWPLPHEQYVREKMLLYAGLRESDEQIIRAAMRWPIDRPIIVDNLAEQLCQAFGSLLFGNDPTWKAAKPDDQTRLEGLAEMINCTLTAAEEVVCSEGEAWWRWVANKELAHPTLHWHSRHDVLPLLSGREVLAAAFVTQLNRLDPRQTTVVWRHVEIQGKGIIRNLLFKGGVSTLGQQMPLTAHYETETLPDTWETNIPLLLCGRVVNKWGARPAIGQSMFKGVWHRLLALTEAVTIGRENMRLTAKKRAVVPASALAPRHAHPGQLTRAEMEGDFGDDGTGMVSRAIERAPRKQFDAGEDILVLDPLDVDEGGNPGKQFQVLEYEFDAEALISWNTNEEVKICTRCDVVPQYIGEGDFGSDPSGTALKIKLIPTVNGAEAKAAKWDDVASTIAMTGQLLEALPYAEGGFGIGWQTPGETPVFERAPLVPEDETEIANRQVAEKSQELISLRAAIREKHPDWTDEQVEKEVEEIRADAKASMPPVTHFGLPPVIAETEPVGETGDGTEDEPANDPPQPAAG